ncbi:P-loop NTPase family protein [Olleya aquimaris]|uniref:Uncharacterized protein n=1 Tax=Olleya aquimaris TaxID=639310 RepID=A0A327RR40_9FLAO|nr:hypothetical protein [Olleya aquimaris]RAJ18134.1 hypothetical protein LY08_00407 [Olleya aquimaris]
MRIYISIFIIILFYGCNKTSNEEIIIQKTFGKELIKKDSLSIELDLGKYNTFDKLFERTSEIACNDSLSKVVIKNNNEIKSVQLVNFCWENTSCILIKRKNTIEIYNDSIYKANLSFPLDSLKSILKKDIYNYGKKFNYSSNPDKLLLYLSFDNSNIEKLTKYLNLVTSTFEKISDTIDLPIVLNEKLNTPPPPPPPLK